MNALSGLAPMVLKGLAGLLLVAAIGAWFLSNRMSLRLQQKYWSGNKVSGAENERIRQRIVHLRIGTGVCVFAAAVVWVAMTTLQAYQS